MSCGCRLDALSVEAQAEVEAKGEAKGEAESGVRRRGVDGRGRMGEGEWQRGRKREDDSQSTGGAQPSQVITASAAEAMTGVAPSISKERCWGAAGMKAHDMTLA